MRFFGRLAEFMVVHWNRHNKIVASCHRHDVKELPVRTVKSRYKEIETALYGEASLLQFPAETFSVQ